VPTPVAATAHAGGAVVVLAGAGQFVVELVVEVGVLGPRLGAGGRHHVEPLPRRPLATHSYRL